MTQANPFRTADSHNLRIATLMQELDIALDPRRWSQVHHDAWHKHLPDMNKAFAVLRDVARRRAELSATEPAPNPQQTASPPWDYLLIVDYHDGSGEPQMMLLTTEQAKLIQSFMRAVSIPQRVQFIPCHEIVPTMEQDDV